MASFNKVILIGNLTRDVEVKYTPSGTAVADMGMAINDKRKTASGEWVEETTFVDVVLWGRTAEVASQYLSKGASAMIEGKLKLEQWERDGKKHQKLKIVADKMVMLGKSGGRSSQSNNNQNDNTYSEPVGTYQSRSSGDDIPF